MFKWIRTLWRAGSGQGKVHQLSGVARPPVKAGGKLDVRRFQHRFTCGCPWPEGVLAPEECPNHPGSERVYEIERTEEMTNVQFLGFPDDA
jgi:hypothetical protein